MKNPAGFILSLTLAALIAIFFQFSSPGATTQAAGGAVLGLPSAACDGGPTAAVTFAWVPAGGTEQWLDLSTFDNDFAPGSFIGVGPMPGSQNVFTWSGILTGVAHVWRVNTLTSSGWVVSATGSFTA